MTDPEREHFARRVHDLENRLRRWQLIAFVLAALLLVPVVGVGLLGVIAVPRMQRERARAMQEERRALEAERAARAAAEDAIRQYDEAAHAKPQAEKRSGEGKD
jgi:hypothetical protein